MIQRGDIQRLIDIMRTLRDPEHGCPWDIAQTPSTIAPYAVEEAYELEEAIRTGDVREIRDELGDVLLQVIFQAQMAAEADQFTFSDVVEAICKKMERRHPHVFATEPVPELDQQGVKQNWERIKADERSAKGKSSVLDDVAVTLPGLLRAVKLQKRMASVGFDWDQPNQVIDKIREELTELEVEIANSDSQVDDNLAAIQAELGDLLFAIANLARHLGINPESAIKQTNAKVIRRFQYIEQQYTDAAAMRRATLAELDRWWDAAKLREANPSITDN